MKVFSVLFTPEAKNDALDARSWYGQHNIGLAGSFRECLDSKIESLKRNPLAASYLYKNLRSSKIKRFPYSIIYKVSGNQIQIIAIFHHSRNPREWKKRI